MAHVARNTHLVQQLAEQRLLARRDTEPLELGAQYPGERAQHMITVLFVLNGGNPYVPRQRHPSKLNASACSRPSLAIAPPDGAGCASSEVAFQRAGASESWLACESSR